MNIIDSPKIGQKISIFQPNIRSSRQIFGQILNQSLILQFKEVEKKVNLESLISKLKIQVC